LFAYGIKSFILSWNAPLQRKKLEKKIISKLIKIISLQSGGLQLKSQFLLIK
jgi:hypothetical protein